MHSSMASSSSRDPEHAVVAASHHRSGRPVIAVASSSSGAAVIGKTRHIPLENLDEEEDLKRHGKRTKKMHIPEDPRLARQRPVVAATASSSHGNHSNGESASAQASKKRVKAPEKVRNDDKVVYQFGKANSNLLLCSFELGLKSRGRSERRSRRQRIRTRRLAVSRRLANQFPRWELRLE